jgi:hypothetical protein
MFLRNQKSSRSLTKVTNFIFLLALSLSSLQTAFAQCGITVGKGTAAADWDAVFTQNGPGTGLEPAGAAGWTGGDSTYSILLPNGSTAFFFSDSYIAESPAKDGDATVSVNERGLRTHKPNCFPPVCPKPETTHYVYNSIVVRSKDGKTLTTLVGPKDAKGFSTSYFKPKNPDHLFWIGDSALVQTDRRGTKKIWIFLYEWDTVKPGEPFSFKFFGASIAELDAETLAVERLEPLAGIDEPDSHWGVAAWIDGRFGNYTFYIYGKKVVDGKKKLFVARVDPKNGLESIRDAKNWTVWNGSGWVAGLAAAASIIPERDAVSDELNVKKLIVDGRPRYVLVTLDTAVPYPNWKDIYLYSACRPEGPFADKYLVYTTPEAGSDKLPGMTETQRLQNKMVVYNPHLHPQLTENGQLLISYNLNLPFGAVPGDSVYVDFYRPRFVKVSIKGLK